MIKDWSKIKEGTLLIITWDDIMACCSWTEDKVAQEFPTSKCKTVGWFINEDKLNIRVTDTVNSDGEKTVAVIPKGCIRKVQVIKYKRIG